MVVSKKGALAYEERRHERLEQNKKKLEQLNLTKLSQALHSTISPKPSPVFLLSLSSIQRFFLIVFLIRVMGFFCCFSFDTYSRLQTDEEGEAEGGSTACGPFYYPTV